METAQVNAQTKMSPVLCAGGHYRIGADLGDDALASLPAFPQTVRVGRDGGLLGHLSVWQNLLLPLEYRARDMRHVAGDAALLFALCGESEANLPRLLDSYPDALPPYERRLAGFVRALLLEPEVLVLDGVFDGLAVAEKEKALRWVQVFRLRFPFRVLLYRGQEDAALNDMECVA